MSSSLQKFNFACFKFTLDTECSVIKVIPSKKTILGFLLQMKIYSQRHPNQWYVPDSLNGQNSVIPPKFKLFDLFDLQLQMYITFLRYLYDKPYVFHHLKYSLESFFW